MKRDNSFDLALQRHARMIEDRRDRVGVGACSVAGEGAAMPRCTQFDLAHLDGHYAQDSVTSLALAGNATVTVTMNPLDTYFCPVAMAMIVRDATDPMIPRVARILQATIRGCLQYDWQNAADTIAGATNWTDSAELDPFARSGCACPINFGCYTNQGNRNALLSFIVGNPHAVPITFSIKLWGVPYSCCPGWANDRNFNQPRDPVPASGPPAPIGRPAVFR